MEGKGIVLFDWDIILYILNSILFEKVMLINSETGDGELG